MDKVMLVIEMPTMSDEAAASLHDLLHSLINAVESHCYHQLQRYYQQSSEDNSPF